MLDYSRRMRLRKSMWQLRIYTDSIYSRLHRSQICLLGMSICNRSLELERFQRQGCCHNSTVICKPMTLILQQGYDEPLGNTRVQTKRSQHQNRWLHMSRWSYCHRQWSFQSGHGLGLLRYDIPRQRTRSRAQEGLEASWFLCIDSVGSQHHSPGRYFRDRESCSLQQERKHCRC